MRQHLAEVPCPLLLLSKDNRGSSAREQGFFMQKDFFLNGGMRDAVLQKAFKDLEGCSVVRGGASGYLPALVCHLLRFIVIP